MAKVVNLNRFRKRRAREEKEKRAERNRRLHGRTKAERARDEAEKKRLEKKLDGAFLLRERVPVEPWEGDPAHALERLEQATQNVATLSEFSRHLTESTAEADEETPADSESHHGESKEPPE